MFASLIGSVPVEVQWEKRLHARKSS
jgi:hypothetical protein